MHTKLDETKDSLGNELVAWRSHWSRNAAGSSWKSAGLPVEAPLKSQIENAKGLDLRFDPASIAEDLPYLTNAAESVAAVLDGAERASWVEATADIGSATPAELMSAALDAHGGHDSTHLSRFLSVVVRDIRFDNSASKR